MTPNKQVVAVAGMAGSGKSLVVNVAEQKGYSKVVMGDEVREETRSRNLQPTPENLGKTMLDMRRTGGEAVIAKRCIPKIEKANGPNVIVDGIRSLSEVEEFRTYFRNFTLVAVYASPETRFKRIYNRKRSDDPTDWKIFQERDQRELSVGLGNAIAMAEHMLVNEETLEITKNRAREILRKVEEKWKK